MAQVEAQPSDRLQAMLEYRSPYERWKASEGLETIRGYFIPNLLKVDLTPWESRGGSGVFINLEGTGGFNDSYVYELAPKESSIPVKHIYEDSIFILKGQGATTVWIDPRKKQTFEWHERSYFAIPPNAWFQHHNLSGTEPARYVGMTSAPRIIDSFKSLDFVFNNPYVFADRFSSEDGYFQEKERPASKRPWATNFVADVMAYNAMPNVVDAARQSVGGRPSVNTTQSFDMVNSTMHSHSSSWPVGTYKAAHRHGPGIHIVILRGTGYTLMRQEGKPIERIDWGPGSMFVPPEMWFHQHFNAGDEPTLFLAIGWGSDKPKAGGRQYLDLSTDEGGDRILYQDEDPDIHRDYEAALAKSGVTCRMGEIHPFCSQK
jgi:oxalate decarboxylase/phosphoglucose isomerase-like protein (cupin superfamily)/quercetin dioxygenase-like cupin family protein